MKLSIIIPNCNGASTILKTINSIYDSKALKKGSFEIIVIDDASTDSSLALVKENFSSVKILILKQRIGASTARNIGIKESNGEYLLFIDNDAWLDNRAISTMLTCFDEEIDIVFPKITYEDGKLLYPSLDIEKTYPHITCGFMIKKQSLKRLDEFFDEFYGTYLEDYDFFMRCRSAGLKAVYLENATVIHENKNRKTDYSHRYYLEIKNTIYGMLKLGGLAKMSGLYNPFTLSALFKAFFCGMFNFAWFNWYLYKRDTGNKGKLVFLIKNENNIFLKNRLKFILLFFQAFYKIIMNLNSIFKKTRLLKAFYISRN